MELSNQQQAGLDKAKSWLDSGDGGVFRFFGYAGTGKTTIARLLADLVEGKVEFACYTGKAAHVLRDKGAKGAGTLHSLIYVPKSKSAARLREMQREYIEIEDATPSHVDELAAIKRQILIEQENMKRPMFALKEGSDLEDAALLVIDEVSMVDSVMGEDLESFGVPILCLGDPAQLPPVKGGGYFTNHEPDVLLTEIHRQAADSPILRVATDVREGRGYKNAGGILVPKGQSVEFMSEFDQILVGTNKTRRIVNDKIRAHRGFDSALPQSGDRIICTRNDGETGLLNGSQWSVLDAHWDANDEELALSIQAIDSDEQLRVACHHDYFLGNEPAYYEVRKKQCFDFAYAMTVHKSQGSQFDSVCLIDEAARFPAHQRKSWRYTGITRAAKRLTIIQ
jgi:exodeoxyribonuclease-5